MNDKLGAFFWWISSKLFTLSEWFDRTGDSLRFRSDEPTEVIGPIPDDAFESLPFVLPAYQNQLGDHMRINVYAEELTNEVKIIEKKIEDGRTFYAVRLFLKSPIDLHHSENDDDRSAITFWVPWKDGANHPEKLCDVMCELYSNACEVLHQQVEREKNTNKTE